VGFEARWVVARTSGRVRGEQQFFCTVDKGVYCGRGRCREKEVCSRFLTSFHLS